MEFALRTSSSPSLSFSTGSNGSKLQTCRRKSLRVSAGLSVETAVSVAVAAVIVGAAATALVKRTQEAEKDSVKPCEACGGTGICPECKGEGFVVQRMSEETAERARMKSTNAATRYTSGLPRKWSYCSKCSSGRSCAACGGTGKLSS